MGLPSSMKKTATVMSIATGCFFVGYLTMRISGSGYCPNPELVADFDPDAYLGVWYELRRDKDIPFETGECVTAEYSLNDNGTVRVSNTQFYGYFDGSDGYQGGVGEAQVNNWISGLLYVYFFA